MRENPELVWEVYLSLEEEFLNYIKYVPLVPNHSNVWSYPLANLLNNIGSSVDSFCKNAIFCESLDDITEIQAIRDDSAKQNMKYYRQVFDTKYHLSDKKIFELQSQSSLCPFIKWRDGNTPLWWKNYTDIKHDRFRNKELATLNATLEALGGLFLLFLNHKETIPVLVDHNIVKTRFTKESCKELLLMGEPISDIKAGIWAKTSLFGYVFESKFSIGDEERKRILSPGYQGY